MIFHDYQLDNNVSKTNDEMTLWKTEKGIVKIAKDTLAVPITEDEKTRGFVFHGKGTFILDTIVETEEGAIGRPIERELDKPFIVLGNPEEILRNLNIVDKEDLLRIGYNNQQNFIAKAENLLAQFFGKKRGKLHEHNCCSGHGIIFAFLNEVDKLDILLAKETKLVYKNAEMAFVSNREKTILKGPNEVVCSNDGRSVFIQK